MPETRREGGLEIGQDLDFQRREWAVQRVGWVVMALLVLAALLGLFGSGPLSHATGEAGPLRVEHPRFWRQMSPMTLSVRLGPEATAGGEVRLRLAGPLLDGVTVESVLPEPERVEAAGDAVVFVLAVAEAGHPASVTFHLRPERPGWFPGRIGLEGRPPLRFGTFVYP